MLFLSLSDVHADTLTEGSPISCTVTLEYDKDALDYTESNTTLPIDFEYSEESNAEIAYFYFLSDKEKLFTSSSDVYAYKVLLYTWGGWGNNSQVIWSKPVLGTSSELVTGNCEYSTIDDMQTYYNENIWIVTDGAIKDIYLGFMHYCYQSFDISGGSSVYNPQIYYHYNFTCSVTPYTVEEYAVMKESNQIAKDTQESIESQTEIMEEQTDIMKEQAETSKGILSSITEFFGGFFDNLISSIIGLIVPGSDELSELFDRLNQFFSDTFGFLYFPFEFMYQLVDVFLNSEVNNGVTITFPGFSMMGYQIWEEMQVPVVQGGTPIYYIFTYIRMGTGCILALSFVAYLRNFFDKRFGGGG